MKVLASFPGKFGDVLWALPSIRALSRRIDAPVHLLIAGQYGNLKPLLMQQPYIADVEAADWWKVQNTAPMTPREPPFSQTQEWDYDAVVHLGYRGWPTRPLPYETLDCLNSQSEFRGSKWTRWGTIPDDDLCLTEPWIRMKRSHELAEVHRCDLAIAFTDEHFELKFGLTCLVLEQFSRSNPGMTYAVLCPSGSRWATETWADTWRSLKIVDWQGYANIIADSGVVLADCSAAHVLAVAMGKPVICMEPNPQRHNAIFYPIGTDGHVLLVRGNDGQPTFDARHTADVVKAIVRAQHETAARRSYEQTH